jgi:hypothetical protein
MTDEELGGIMAGAGVAAAILGGFVAGGLGSALKKAIMLSADSTPAKAARYSWGAARTVDAVGGLVAVAGIGAAGYGTYIAVKSATDSAIGAAGATVGAVLLAAYGGYAGYVTGVLTSGLGKIAALKANALGENWSVGQFYNPVKMIRKIRGARQAAAAARAEGEKGVQELNDLLAGSSQRSSEQLLVRSKVSVKSQEVVVAPQRQSLGQAANAYQHETSTTQGAWENLMKNSDHTSVESAVDPTTQGFLKKVMSKW